MEKIPKCGRLSRPVLWSTFGRTIIVGLYFFLLCLSVLTCLFTTDIYLLHYTECKQQYQNQHSEKIPSFVKSLHHNHRLQSRITISVIDNPVIVILCNRKLFRAVIILKLNHQQTSDTDELLKRMRQSNAIAQSIAIFESFQLQWTFAHIRNMCHNRHK